MKKILLSSALILTLTFVTACKEQKETTITELKTPQEKLGYALGSDIGKSFKKNEMEIDQNAFYQGFIDSMNDAKLLLTDEEIKVIQQDAVKQMKEKFAQKRNAEAEKNKKDGEAFLTENGKKEGIITTESGLQYQIIQDGEGPMPLATDRVSVHYTGTLIDGTEFDSSVKRGKPSTFSVKGVIPGWTEALQLMKAGSKWKIYVPSNLAYRERGAGKMIGPNSTLIFDIELVEIVKKAEAAEAPAKKDQKS